MGQIASLKAVTQDDDMVSKALMMFVYEKRSFSPISFVDFVKSPASFVSQPLILYEPSDGITPTCGEYNGEQYSYASAVRSLHQSYKVVSQNAKHGRLWVITSHTISQAMLREVTDACRTIDFCQFQSVSGISCEALFSDLPHGTSVSTAMRQVSNGMRGSNPTRPLAALSMTGPLALRRSQQVTMLQTTFMVAEAPLTPLNNGPRDCDLIVDRVYVGSEAAARNTALMTELGITHIVNMNSIDSKTEERDGMHRCNVAMSDSVFQSLPPDFWEAIHFVTEAIASGGTVLIHCRRGVSRSASLCVAWLMHSRQQSYDLAYSVLKKQRPVVNINEGFAAQLKAKEIPRSRPFPRGKLLDMHKL